MEFNYVVPNTVQQFVKYQSQISRHAFPFWVSALSYLLTIGGTALLTFGLFLLFQMLMQSVSLVGHPLVALIPAGLLAYNFMVRVIAKRANSFFLKFVRYNLDFEFTCQTSISERGIRFDEGDRQTQIAWSAIGGVFQTKSFIVFYCRGLFYNVPLEDVGTLEQQDRLLQVCKAWQSAAQGHATAKVFT